MAIGAGTSGINLQYSQPDQAKVWPGKSLAFREIGSSSIDCCLLKAETTTCAPDCIGLIHSICDSPDAMLKLVTVDIGLRRGNETDLSIVEHYPVTTLKGSKNVKHISTHVTFDPSAGGAGFEGHLGEAGRATERDETTSWDFKASGRPRVDGGVYDTLRLQWQARTLSDRESFAGRPLHAAAVLSGAVEELTTNTVVHAKLLLWHQKFKFWRRSVGDGITKRKIEPVRSAYPPRSLDELRDTTRQQVETLNHESTPKSEPIYFSTCKPINLG
ncbi:hypothetical protein LTR56_003478 [Elasticomyces elasticus]|nr:hypothetical protein LTR22_010954 [Elasticomyces elasticus]KAK3655471.1 hypothetical protein LTR56_003478 [Elasticomyces elasticus]KAK5756726.1 hypothetical protein LTS12_013190 [Elasticomyces elasticus]